ncbi:unnamed protein product, partial [Cuscuta campestris]
SILFSRLCVWLFAIVFFHSRFFGCFLAQV